MAGRSLSVPSRSYGAGPHPPYAVDGFTRDTASLLRATLTVEAWPDLPDALRVVMAWDTGEAARFVLPGVPLDAGGAPLSVVTLELDVPRLSGGVGRAAVTHATLSLDCTAEIVTALTLEAI